MNDEVPLMKLAIHGGKPVFSRMLGPGPLGGQPHLKAIDKAMKQSLLTYVGGIHGNSGQYFFGRELEEKFASYHETKYAIALSNGTAALAIALRAAGVDCGDEVILQPFTCFANVEAIVQAGAIPVFVDIDPDTYCIDTSRIEEKITAKTKAVTAIHWGGRPADLDKLRAITRKHGLALIEDACVAQGAEWKGRKVGSFGKACAISFGWGKMMSCGEGGMLITNDRKMAETCHALKNRGRNNKGEPIAIGWNCRISEILSAFLLQKLKEYPSTLQNKIRNVEYLKNKMAGIPGIELLKNDTRITCDVPCHFTFKFKEKEFGTTKQKFVKAAGAEGVSFGSFDAPLYRYNYFRKNGVLDQYFSHFRGYKHRRDYTASHYPASETAYLHEGLYLSHECLGGRRPDMDNIVKVIEKVRTNAHELR